MIAWPLRMAPPVSGPVGVLALLGSQALLLYRAFLAPSPAAPPPPGSGCPHCHCEACPLPPPVWPTWAVAGAAFLAGLGIAATYWVFSAAWFSAFGFAGGAAAATIGRAAQGGESTESPIRKEADVSVGSTESSDWSGLIDVKDGVVSRRAPADPVQDW